jgi:glyoxylate/hydroxypyruvate reductase A
VVNLLTATPRRATSEPRNPQCQLQPGGYLINVARGAYLVEADLIELLDSDHLAGAT